MEPRQAIRMVVNCKRGEGLRCLNAFFSCKNRTVERNSRRGKSGYPQESQSRIPLKRGHGSLWMDLNHPPPDDNLEAEMGNRPEELDLLGRNVTDF